MLHHLSIAVTDLTASTAFYDAALLPLGYVQVFADDEAVGYGVPGGGDQLAIKLRAKVVIPEEGFHIAFRAPDRESVTRFYEAALAHGGKDNGGSGLHPEYGDNYWAAFVFDPDGYRIEAVINKAC
jgi:catechol 2,3-dioxygenase-like lactoylglutathione lyase family enzyme